VLQLAKRFTYRLAVGYVEAYPSHGDKNNQENNAREAGSVPL
jgi:hypothetical protein